MKGTMNKKVELSTYGMVNTIVTLTTLIGLLCWQAYKDVGWAIWMLAGVIVFFCFIALFYAPMSISLSDKELSIHRSLRIKDIPLSEIASVSLCPPTMIERRICGSGGFFGYWGIFSEPSIGRYFAYYGKASDCFLVVLNNGKKYMLGCKDAPEMVAAIEDNIRHR